MLLIAGHVSDLPKTMEPLWPTSVSLCLESALLYHLDLIRVCRNGLVPGKLTNAELLFGKNKGRCKNEIVPINKMYTISMERAAVELLQISPIADLGMWNGESQNAAYGCAGQNQQPAS